MPGNNAVQWLTKVGAKEFTSAWQQRATTKGQI